MIAPLLFVLLAQAAPAAAQTAAPIPAQTPARTPAPAAPAAPGGRAGRGGGVTGPGPAVGGEIDEKPVITQHSVSLDGKKLEYTATVGQMPLKDASGETEAHIFYMAYTLDGISDR